MAARTLEALAAYGAAGAARKAGASLRPAKPGALTEYRNFSRTNVRSGPEHRRAWAERLLRPYDRFVGLRRDDQYLAIVVLGLFNPPIFQPAWMAAEGLMREGDADAVEIEIVHPEATVFNTPWFRCEVTRERFSLRTSQESHYLPLRDLVCSLFTSLSHTPTSAFGVNLTEFFQFEDRKSFDDFGWALVPPDRWTALSRPGMARLEVQGDRPDENDGWIRVRVEPILDDSLRVLVEVNDHFGFRESNEYRGPNSAITGTMTDLLVDEWAAITGRAAKVFAELEEQAR